ncbi:hypothetical protein BJY04DRAFT_215072 [Aspergillus karnatakaensis]|uniref:uncharacterized protein n=1 Tax=Aspergillus karnatakaensis TaxID=1810916 RepID=UPI003CCD6AAF
MAEGLSAAASVVGLAAAAIQSVQFLYNTIDNIKGSPEMIKNVQTDLHSVESILKKLHNALKDDTCLVLNDVAKRSVEDCDAACKRFQTVLARWMKRSSEDKAFWADRWKVALFGLEKIKAFRGRLNDYKMTISVALLTATYIRTTQHGNVVADIKDMLLKQNKLGLRKELSRVDSRVTELEDDQKQLSLLNFKYGDEERQCNWQELLEDLRQQQAANDARRQAFDAELSSTVRQRTGQKIRGVKATNNSAALAGFMNTEAQSYNIDQDISDITACNWSVAAAGVVKDFDFGNFGRQASNDRRK